jgi:hypothetical protein
METWECTLSGISDRHKESVRRFWRNKVMESLDGGGDGVFEEAMCDYSAWREIQRELMTFGKK